MVLVTAVEPMFSVDGSFKRLNVAEVVVMSPPLTARSPDKVEAPVTPSVVPTVNPVVIATPRLPVTASALKLLLVLAYVDAPTTASVDARDTAPDAAAVAKVEAPPTESAPIKVSASVVLL